MTVSADYAVLERLYTVIAGRKGGNPDTSYVAKLFARGRGKVAQKVGEEAVETVIAAVEGNKKDVIEESTDLLFHLMVLWADCGVAPQDVLRELERREGVSGLDTRKRDLRRIEQRDS